MADPILVIGTGTSVGKTHVAERLLRALAAEGRQAYGYKPIESGVTGAPDDDASRLVRASSFHVKHVPFRLTLRAPISPHLAARIEGITIDVATIRDEICRLANLAEVLVVELPGGAFSPITEDSLVAHFARTIRGARVLLVAPDRLGVLHDLGATARASAALGLMLQGIALNAPAVADDSTGHNAAEIGKVTSVPLLAEIARGAPDEPIGPSDPARGLARALTR